MGTSPFFVSVCVPFYALCQYDKLRVLLTMPLRERPVSHSLSSCPQEKSNLYVSLTHSGQLTAIALSCSKQPGCCCRYAQAIFHRFETGLQSAFFDLTRCKGALIKNKQIRDGNNEPRSEILKRHQPRVGHARSTSLTYRSNRPERSASCSWVSPCSLRSFLMFAPKKR